MGFSKTETKMKNILSPEQQAILQGIASQVMPQLGQGAEVYQGQIAPGPSSLQQQAFQQLGGALTSGQTGQALSDLLSGKVDMATREKLYNTAEAQALAGLQKQLPYLEERYNAMGAGRSGGLQHALGQAAGDVSLGLGALRDQLLYQEEMAAKERQAQGLGLWSGLVGQQLQAGQMQRGIAGEQAGEQYSKWLAGQPYANPWLTSYIPTILGTQTKAPSTSGWGFSMGGGG